MSWLQRSAAVNDAQQVAGSRPPPQQPGAPRNLQEAIAAGRMEAQAKEVQEAGGNQAVPFAELDSARAWQQRRSEDEEHEKHISAMRSQVKRDPNAKKIERYMQGMEEKLPGGAAEKCKPFLPVLGILVTLLYFLAKYIAFVVGLLYKLWEVAPQNLIKLLYGVSLCFFGGTFAVSIAAIEAFLAAGWQRAYYSALKLYDDMRHVGYQLERDEYVDDNRDGIADVDQMSGQGLVQRKTRIALTTIRRPQETQLAFANVWAAYLAVLATLKFQFARTTAFAIGIAQSTQFFFLKVFGPPLAMVMPHDTHHWIPTIIDSMVHLVALVIAWYLQMVISAVTSGLRGGVIATRAALAFANDRGMINLKESDTILDEALGMAVAAAGIFFQLTNGFALPFPFNIFLLPLTIVEWWARWQVTWG